MDFCKTVTTNKIEFIVTLVAQWLALCTYSMEDLSLNVPDGYGTLRYFDFLRLCKISHV